MWVYLYLIWVVIIGMVGIFVVMVFILDQCKLFWFGVVSFGVFVVVYGLMCCGCCEYFDDSELFVYLLC